MDRTALIHSRLWLGAFLVATFGSAALVKGGLLPMWPGMAIFAASFLLLIPLVRSVEHAQEVCGANSVAMRTYNRRMMTSSFAYVALLLGGVAIARYYAPPVPARIVIAIVVAAPILFMIRAMARLIKDERDEYLRMRIVEQTLIATGFVLAVSTIYGFLNAFDVLPRVDAYWTVPLWGLGLGVGRLLQRNG